MKVKCIICGAEFEDDVDICPVCGVGKEYFEPVEEKTVKAFNTNEKYVIIGNGIAGFSAAKAIRERDKSGEILILSKDKQYTYNRPMLTKAMENLKVDDILVEPESWYETHNIIVKLDVEIKEIDTATQSIADHQGHMYPYTKLILTCGSESFIPPIPGKDKSEVIAIRRIEDIQKIHNLLPLRQAVVIGGGVLGLEAAWELKQTGCEVSVLELAPTLMGRQLDDDAAMMVKRLAEKQGITLKTGVTIKEISGIEHVEAVTLENGETFPCQCVIISCGVRANAALAQEAGIHCERGIVVNERMETSMKNIYAAGDCAQFQGMNFALWAEAMEQGETAGANAASDPLNFTNIHPALTFNGFNTHLFAVGDVGKNKELAYEIKGTMSEETMNRRYYVNGKLVGAILIGDTQEAAEILKQI